MWLTLNIFDERVTPTEEQTAICFVCSPASFPGRSSFKLLWSDTCDISEELKREVEELVQPHLTELRPSIGAITARFTVDLILHHAAGSMAGAVHSPADPATSHTTQ